MPAGMMRVNITGEKNDCARVALATYLGESVEDVLRATVKIDKRKQGRLGLTPKHIIRIAAEIGHVLKWSRYVDWHHDFGILLLHDHAVVLRNGLVFDSDGTVVDSWAWMVGKKYRSHNGILVEESP